jgi:hypothetical protein
MAATEITRRTPHVGDSYVKGPLSLRVVSVTYGWIYVEHFLDGVVSQSQYVTEAMFHERIAVATWGRA